MRRDAAFVCVWLAAGLTLIAAQDIVIESAVREINLATQITSITYRYVFKNSGETPTNSLQVCYSADQAGHEAVVEFLQDREQQDQGPLKFQLSNREEHGAVCAEVHLNKPLLPGSSTVLEGGTTLTQLQVPYPASVFQNEPQRMVYKDNIFLLSPYSVLRQTTKVTLPSQKVESFSQQEPSRLKGKTIVYGEYTNIEPFTKAEMRLHFENNTPFAVATKLDREIEISHWGNVYVEERYIIKHTGAKIRGEWSRLDLMTDPHTFGRAAIRGFVASLPPRADRIYFKDAIGNISSSQVKRGLQSTEVVITPRYPLYGGWQAEFVLGYSIPLSDAVSRNSDTGLLRLMFLFGTPLMGLVVEEIENRVVLPEGSKVAGMEGTFEVELSSDKKFTYLDTSGRPVVVLRKKNLSFEHNQPFVINYSFYALSLLREPLLLVAFFALSFLVVIGFNRLDLTITRDDDWLAAQKAERSAFLVQEITAIMSEREKDVYAASTGSGQDASSFQARLRSSEEKLKKRCAELESTAGPQHSAKVQALLEKERALQSKILQIAAAQGSSDKGARARATEELQEAASSLQKSHAAKVKTLN